MENGPHQARPSLNTKASHAAPPLKATHGVSFPEAAITKNHSREAYTTDIYCLTILEAIGLGPGVGRVGSLREL